MRFVEEPVEQAVDAIAAHLVNDLHAGKRVLWLVCGGSSIAAEVEIMRLVHDKAETDLDGLAILPTDERYGKPGHADSNYQQLKHAGFEPGTATWVDVLMHDVSLEQTVSFYTDVAAAAFANADVILGVFGMGANAHVAGLQPGSPAVAPGEASVAGFKWDDFTRLTLTAPMLERVTIAYALVYGDKKQALERLQANQEPFEKMPAKVLYKIPNVFIYNDHISSEE